MHIKELSLINFRNYKKFICEFNKNYNVIYGKNAQGKTNILEAIFLCSSGRSHRTRKDIELINFLEDAYYINLDVTRKYTDSKIEICYSKDEGKKIKLNSVPTKKNVELMGKLNTIMFSPEDLNIIKGSPSERRKYIDIAISQIKPSYFYNLQQYSKILTERNHLLKDINKKKKISETLEIWNESLVETGAKIINERNIFIKSLNEIVKKKHEGLTDGKEQLEIKYEPSVKFKNNSSIADIKDCFIKDLDIIIDREIKICSTLLGPQRDDIDILINNNSVKLYGSQGQQRTVVLSLKLAEVDIVEGLIGELPVLLLDDVLSELDEKRQQYLINNIKGMQVFITTTEKNFVKICNIESDISLYKIENGNIIKDT